MVTPRTPWKWPFSECSCSKTGTLWPWRKALTWRRSHHQITHLQRDEEALTFTFNQHQPGQWQIVTTWTRWTPLLCYIVSLTHGWLCASLWDWASGECAMIGGLQEGALRATVGRIRESKIQEWKTRPWSCTGKWDIVNRTKPSWDIHVWILVIFSSAEQFLKTFLDLWFLLCVLIRYLLMCTKNLAIVFFKRFQQRCFEYIVFSNLCTVTSFHTVALTGPSY